MQHMQDKEFDALFKNRFESAEIEPSANLWNNIEEKLVVKRKRVLPLYWSAAAAIIAAVAVGLLFQQHDKISLDNTTAVVRQSGQGRAVVAVGRGADSKPAVVKNNNQYMASLQHHTEVEERGYNPFETGGTVMTEKTEEKDLLVMQPSVKISHLVYKEAKVKQETVKLPEPAAKPVEEVMVASAEVTEDTNNETEELASENKRTESRGIRNVGDLVNYVVDKVDKREEKFIQFKTDNDDNSSLIGLNIGMFKFNQRKHK
jgi:hypothetical protein